MRLKISVFALLMTVVFVMSSCLGDTETVEVYDDTAVTSVTLGTLKCVVHTLASDGITDSTYTRSYTGSSYPVHIDQIKHEIFNVDSLPMGTDMEHILVTVNTKNGGVAVLKSLTSDSIMVISNTDSLDFSKPRELIVYSYSGLYNQSYKVNFAAHKESADVFRWQNCKSAESIAAYKDIKSLVFADNLYVLGTSAGSAEIVKKSTEDTSSAWSAVAFPVALTDKASFIADENSLYVYDNGKIYTSADGINWTDNAVAGISKLIGVCKNEMFALSAEGEIKVSTDGGMTWVVDALDSDKSYLPSQDICCSSVALVTNADVSRVVMTGNRNEADYAEDASAVVWSKIVDEDMSMDQPWAYNEFDEKNNYTLPCLAGLSVVPYADGIIAIGGKGLAGCENEGFTQMYFSIDNGITWHEDSRFKLPSGFAASTKAAIAVDKENWIWIIGTGTGAVWRGRLNRLGWKIQN